MRFSVFALVALVTGCFGGGCSTGEPARPKSELAPTVGPSPLRRLSNEEYLNALADTFPTLHPILPALPHDLAVAGFENAAEAQEPNDVRIARFEDVADRYAAEATADSTAVKNLVHCEDWSTAEAASGCADRFLRSMGTRLFRRPITEDEVARFRASFGTWQAAVDFEGAVRLTLTAMLQAPQFLYRVEVEPPPGELRKIAPVDPYAMATRLSFLFWASVPDQELLNAATRDELHTDEQIGEQTERMLADPRARRMYWSFHRQWLGLDRILLEEDLVRTPEVDPGWSSTTRTAAQMESELFVENVLGEGGTFKDLLTSRRGWVNGEMARLYNLPAPADPAAWSEATLPAERAGLLTRVSFLASYSHRGATSPPVRANGIQLRLMCRTPQTPPADADLSQPLAKAGEGPQTNRMLFATRTASARCQQCHANLNGIGFGLESYNAAGIFETSQNGLPIDASGILADAPFNGGIELSNLLAESEVVHRCATQQWFRFAFGRGATNPELRVVEELTKSFTASGGDVHALLRAIALSPSFRLRQESFE